MGCALSDPGVTPDPAISEEKRCPSLECRLDSKAELECRGEEQTTEPFPLSEAQKVLIQESWKILHKDIARVGIIVFIRLFETHPECKDAFFLFRDIDDLQQLKMSKELQAHGLRVMSFIEKSVARLDQVEKLEQLAFELGRSHCRYKAPPKYYEYVGAQFIQAVQPMLKEEWTLEVEKAWESSHPDKDCSNHNMHRCSLVSSTESSQWGRKKHRTSTPGLDTPEASNHVALHVAHHQLSKMGDVPRPLSTKSLYNFLLAVSLMGFSASGQMPLPCQEESMSLLRIIIQRMGNSSDATLYTPEDITVCYADTLKCFHTELQVIQTEHEEHTGILSQLSTRLRKLEAILRKSCANQNTKCQPCEGHPEQPVPVFLSRLLMLFQEKCRTAPRQGLMWCSSPTP